MRFAPNLAVAASDSVRQELLQAVEHVLRLIQRNHNAHDQLKLMLKWLDSQPVAASEYGTAVNRFRNAYRFLVSQERGAARCELQLLASTLRNRDDGNSGPRFGKLAVER